MINFVGKGTHVTGRRPAEIDEVGTGYVYTLYVHQ